MIFPPQMQYKLPGQMTDEQKKSIPLPLVKEIIPPAAGWESHTWYIVDVAYRADNPIHRSLFYTGFLNDATIGIDGKASPGGYNSLVALNGTSGDRHKTIDKVYYLKAIKRLFSEKEANALEDLHLRN